MASLNVPVDPTAIRRRLHEIAAAVRTLRDREGELNDAIAAAIVAGGAPAELRLERERVRAELEDHFHATALLEDALRALRRPRGVALRLAP